MNLKSIYFNLIIIGLCYLCRHECFHFWNLFFHKQISNKSISIEQPLDSGFYGVWTGFCKVPWFGHHLALLMALSFLKYLLKIKRMKMKVWQWQLDLFYKFSCFPLSSFCLPYLSEHPFLLSLASSSFSLSPLTAHNFFIYGTVSLYIW